MAIQSISTSSAWTKTLESNEDFFCVCRHYSCLGLFGLSIFTTEQRKKEIGIRKVMGASVLQLVKLLSGNFTRLVIIAILISIPLSWWLMEQWLSDFAYRIEIGIVPYLLACSAALLIAWLTVSWQSVRAAMINPVNSLRSD